MKNLLIGLICFLSITSATKAQYFTPINNYQQPLGLSVVKYFGIPYGATPALQVTRTYPGALFFSTTDSSLYIWSGTQWQKNGSGSGSGNTYIDSLINIYNYYTNIQNSQNKLISGALIHDTLLTFRSTNLVYQINDSIYSALADSIVLPDADVSNNKYVVVYIDINGDLGYIAGSTPPPSIPIVNEDTQLLLGTYEIKAGALVPTGITNYDIYKEATDGWALLKRGTISTGYDSMYTVNPFAGAVSLLIPAVVNGQYFEFEDGADYNVADAGYLSWYLRLRATFAANCRLTVSLWYNNSQVSVGGVQLVTGVFGFDRTVVNQYQLNAIPTSAFQMQPGSGGTFNKIRITLSGTNASGFQMDNIKLQAGGLNNSTITGVIKYNNRDGNVFPIKADYSQWFIDSAGLNSDSTSYRYFANGVQLFTLPTFRTLSLPGYLIAFDSIDFRTTKIRVDSIALAALLGGSGSIDTTSLSNRINLKQNLITLTTTGSSGASTFNQSTGALNIPQYSGGGTSLDSLRKKGQYLDSVVAYSDSTGTFAFRKEQFFNVKDYGAKADGATDNTAAFQTAINLAVAAGGGTIYIPYDTNTYKISGALVTSVDGVNPNAQLYIPLVTNGSAKKVNIKFLGGTVPNFFGLIPTTQGVILESTIQGTGTNPSVIGSSWEDDVSLGLRNFVNVSFENLIVRTSTIVASVHVAGTMSAINGSKLAGMMTRNIKADVSSSPNLQAEPVNETFGFIFPAAFNAGQLISDGVLFAQGYRTGSVFQEHYSGQRVISYGCIYGIALDTSYHSINIWSLSVEGNRVGVQMRGAANVIIKNFSTEHFSSGWNAAEYDVKFENPPLAPVARPYPFPFIATRSVTIDQFNHVTPAVGATNEFLTNDSTKVFLRKVHGLDLVESIQYPASTATHAINLLSGSRIYMTLTAHTAVNFYKSFFGKEVTIYAKQDATGGRNLTVMSQPIGVNNTAGATTKINAVNTANGWVITAEPFDTTGKQGFGTTIPQYDLHTKRASGANGAVINAVENTNSTGESVFLLKSSTGTAALELFNSGAAPVADKFSMATSSAITEFRIATFGNNPINFGTNTTTIFNNTRMTILGTGEVGIGTVSPSVALHVIKAAEQLRIGHDASNYMSVTTNSTGSTSIGLTGTTPELTLPPLTSIGTNFSFNNTSKVFALGGTTPSTWALQSGVIEGGGGSIWFTTGSGGDMWATGNAFFDGGWKYKAAGVASNIGITGGQVWLRAAASGSANGAVTWLLPLMADKAGVRIGDGTTPTALLHIKAGTATASTAPLKFTSGTVTTTPEAGAVEFDGTNYWVTIGTTRTLLTRTITGTAAPATTPAAVGMQFVDTVNKKLYVATGTASSADWTILN